MAKKILYFPEVSKEEHDDSQLPPTKRTLLYGWDSVNLQKVRVKVNSDGELPITATATTERNALQFATDSGVSTTFYLGEADAGTITSASSWRIQKFTTASGVQGLWADGNTSADNIWDNREDLSYS